MIDLRSLVREYGPYREEKGGQELRFKCPKCGRRKFYVNPEKLKAHCFRCTYSKRFPRMLKHLVKAIQPRQKEPGDQEIEPPNIRPVFSTEIREYLAKRLPLHQIVEGLGMDANGRLFIPIIENGKTMSYILRSVNGGPKEISGPNRSHFLYGWDQVYDRHVERVMSVVLVEGIFDQIKINSFNWPCLALMGSSISDIQIGKLVKLNPLKVILMMDGDDAGRKATKTIATKLGKRMNPMNIVPVYLPEGKDPDELSREEFNVLIKGV